MTFFDPHPDDRAKRSETIDKSAAQCLVSLLVALLAYCGLLIGGGIVANTRAQGGDFQSSSTTSSPQLVASHDAQRGAVLPDKSTHEKQGLHKPSLATASENAELRAVPAFFWTLAAPAASFPQPPHRSGYDARGPPARLA